jgi:RNA polymerase sigma-70 factor (ECF subfamily)
MPVLAGEKRPDALDVAAIVGEHAGFVWATLQRFGVREPDLEDLSQEVFLAVHARLATYDPQARITTWLYGICLRVASNYRRRAYVRRELPVAEPPDQDESSPGQSPEDAAMTRQARERLDAMLNELDLDKRAVFVMFEIDGLSCDEIAAIAGVPVGTVYSRLHAARKAFARAFARWQARHGREEARR